MVRAEGGGGPREIIASVVLVVAGRVGPNDVDQDLKSTRFATLTDTFSCQSRQLVDRAKQRRRRKRNTHTQKN